MTPSDLKREAEKCLNGIQRYGDLSMTHVEWATERIEEAIKSVWNAAKEEDAKIAHDQQKEAEDMYERTEAVGWMSDATASYDIAEKIRATQIPTKEKP